MVARRFDAAGHPIFQPQSRSRRSLPRQTTFPMKSVKQGFAWVACGLERRTLCITAGGCHACGDRSLLQRCSTIPSNVSPDGHRGHKQCNTYPTLSRFDDPRYMLEIAR